MENNVFLIFYKICNGLFWTNYVNIVTHKTPCYWEADRSKWLRNTWQAVQFSSLTICVNDLFVGQQVIEI